MNHKYHESKVRCSVLLPLTLRDIFDDPKNKQGRSFPIHCSKLLEYAAIKLYGYDDKHGLVELFEGIKKIK